MTRKFLLASCAALAIASPHPAKAQLAEGLSIAALVTIARQGLEYLTGGAQQISNYLKGQVFAQQQNLDADNVADATFALNMRRAEIRDQHTVSPASCESLDGGQSIAVAAGQTWVVSASLSRTWDGRREGGAGMPAWDGAGQAAAARSQLHRNRYCGPLDAAEGICTLTDRPNGDLRSASMTGFLSYGPQQENMNAAADFWITALQPIPLPALRGDALRAAQGQDTKIWRDRYAANMSLAMDVGARYQARRAPSVTLTPAQRVQQQAQGMVVTAQGSWLQAASLEVNRRVGGQAWNNEMARMPPAEKLNEIARMMALSLHLDFERLIVAEDVANTNAAILATLVERDTGRPQEALQPQRAASEQPTPQMR